MDTRRVFVAFNEKTDLKWLRFFLPRGFRHCSVILNDGASWVSVEALAGYTEITRHDVGPDYDLIGDLRKQGMVVLETKLRRDDKTRKALPPALFSCVEAVKRVLGVRKSIVFTPSQLYAFLKQDGAQ